MYLEHSKYVILWSLKLKGDYMSSYQPFVKALVWNTINVFLYKILLQIHQASLFYVISKELFGISGTLFSSIYLAVSLTNFGFDYSLFAFYQYYRTSQHHFIRVVKQLLIRSVIVMITAMIMSLLIIHYQQIPNIAFIARNIPLTLLPFIISIFITESMKKSFETLAHLSFLNKAITIIDIGCLSTYIALVWSLYLTTGFIDLHVMFIPMAIISWIELCALARRLYTFYQQLPNTKESMWEQSSNPHPTSREVISNQAVNYINQITKAIFSPNFIIIFLAYHLGMIKAGYIKLVIDFIILSYMLLNRAVGIPSGAILSNSSTVKSLVTQDPNQQPTFKITFLKITNSYIQFLYVFAITTIAAIVPFFLKTNHVATTTPWNVTIMANILFFALAGFMEYIIITYEKLFLTQGAAGKLALINAVSLCCILLAIHGAPNLPVHFLLLPFIVIRICTIGTIILVAYNTWYLLPSFMIRPKTALAAICCITLCTIWHVVL